MKTKTLTLMLFVLLMVALQHPTISEATTYYVSTSGNDSNSGTTTGAPWRTVKHAASTMVAGDTTFVRAGTYTENLIEFTNSGTAGNVITLAAYVGETPIIDSGLRATTGRTPVFHLGNSHSVNYITLDGLTIQYGSTANVYISYNVPATNITIQNCTMLNLIQADNGSHIYMDPGSDNILIQNNYIHDYITGGYVGNAANGIVIFGTQPYSGGMNVTIQNNEIYGNLINGIYYKHSQVSDTTSVTTIKNNLIHITGGVGIRSSRDAVRITNNVIYSTGSTGINIYEAQGPGSANNNFISHNTISAPGGIEVSSAPSTYTGTIIKDNLITQTSTSTDAHGISIWRYGPGTDTSNTTIDHTLVYSPASTSMIYVPGSGFVSVTALPNSALGRVGNLNTAPIFVNEAAHNYTLTSSSPGYHAASDGTDMGANISLVGPQGRSSGLTPVAAPTGLTVIPLP